ncbi:FG-GAP repeat domain-containing protein [Crateriforma conspicua]|nr:VCBS repeat-containing protein [Crateriforma conspicua]
MPSVSLIGFSRRILPALCLVASMMTAWNGDSSADPTSTEIRSSDPTASWQRHTIDNSLVGADGVRLGDFNHDGRTDIVTGWEESGVVRLYLHPGAGPATQPWPALTIGHGDSVEDAFPIDVDGDRHLEVISCHEGKTRKVMLHRPNGNTSETIDVRNPNQDATKRWLSQTLSSLASEQWMFGHGIQLHDGRQAVVFGSKGRNASITLLRPTVGTPETIEQWTPQRLRDAGWIMSLRCVDIDQDGDDDIVYSDRKGPLRGVGWLEQPDDLSGDSPWNDHILHQSDHEVMFLQADPNQLFVATRDGVWLRIDRNDDGTWHSRPFPNPAGVPHGKAIARLNDGRLVMTANTLDDADPTPAIGIWISDPQHTSWSRLGTAQGAKFDRIECVDIDGDGDQDILTCEERFALGVVWYENPQHDASQQSNR